MLSPPPLSELPARDSSAVPFGTEELQQRLRETVARLRQALEAAELGTWAWDCKTDLIELDERAAALFGVPFGATITRSALRRRIVLPEHLDAVNSALKASLESGRPYVAEYRIGPFDGQPRWICANGVTVCKSGVGAAVTGMVGTVQDVTARKLQEQTLRESEKLAATGRLAATIAHEINNPLEAITNLIYLARTDPAVPAHVQELLATADSELARVSQLAQQTLGFYRDTTRPVSIDLNRLLCDSVELFARKMQGKSVDCVMDLEPGLTLVALQGEIRQVVSNLLVNAIDASSHTPIRVRARRRVHTGASGRPVACVDIVVADCGIGIPAAVRPRLFTAFVTSKQSGGTGLGLWVTRGIVEKQGGSIGFRTSTESPTGTVFRMVLPVTPQGASGA